MTNRYSLGATVLGIFLVAIFGINRAFNWLRDSPGDDSFADGGELVEIGGDNSREPRNADDGFIEDTRATRSQTDNRTRISQANDGTRRQSNNGLSEEVFDPTPLETAGTYIQRQQGAALDQIVADSQVEATPLSPDGSGTNSSLATQNNTQTDPLDPLDSSSSAAPGSTAPASESVPALW
ncbi:hypothetical protein [cf. Phormidesmis sp. LEGE 11477]|uniref:hypothetical protein n=1 Tax=cf. Phormidesmis sp. LEGE 11477 TaxID=1828680 RepID=UPI00188284ED|nr:hypothetical protein [cf. Phormidesmis sp. LEGE 11477]MBE9064823.1 hypothetical protein [cf. Phormidesmis sp. LEGE 11477]